MKAKKMYLKQAGLQKAAVSQHHKLINKNSGIVKTLVGGPQN
jgi:hypothetical protein